MSRALGYQPNGARYQVSREKPAQMLDLVLDRADWLPRGPAATTITGLEPCLSMFGLPTPAAR